MASNHARRITHRLLCGIGLVQLLAAAGLAHALPSQSSALETQGVVQGTVAVNRLSMRLTNCGWFATDPDQWQGGLEFPRGSGKLLGFAGGLWFSGRAAGSLRTAITEYDTEFMPGPGTPGGPALDTLRHRVYSISRGDTTGSGAWMARAVPLGAPVDSNGTHPGLVGEQTLWTVCTDAGVTSQVYGRGPRTPIGLEVQLTAYAFGRGAVLQDVIFLHYRIIHRGSDALDSAYVGLWYDADMRTASIPAGSDTSLDLAYVYRLSDDVLYGTAGPATGVMLLRGPRDGGTGPAQRARSVVGYINGSDPASPEQYDAVLRGLYPWGAEMIDATTSLPTLFYAWGDPVTGTGWLKPDRVDMKLLLAAGPFHFAPGDTQVVDAAVVVGQGIDRLGSIVAMRANAQEARGAFGTGFAGVPDPPVVVPRVQALFAWPNPSPGSVQFDVRVPAGGARVVLDILDLSGRRVRRVADDWRAGGSSRVSWDGRTDAGTSAPAGLYFANARVAGAVSRTRIVLVR